MLKQLKPAVVSVLVMTAAFGLIFPLVITAIAQVAFHRQANGSLIVRNGKVIGSALIGQSFSRPEYFHPRPSAAGSGYDASSSGGTNLGPTSAKLIDGIHNRLANGHEDPNNFDGIKDLAAAYRKENGLVPNAAVPADAVTRSASGLDPDISPENAALQVDRVAKARGVAPSVIARLVADHTSGRSLGLFGEPRVNVLELNLALDRAVPRR